MMDENSKNEKKLHIVMFPWLAFGHMTPFLHLANILAQKGHKVSIFIPPKAQPKLAHLNLQPNLITFISINLPPVNGLPNEAQTTSDTPVRAGALLFDAFDLTRPEIESSLSLLRPGIVLYDFPAYWIASLARKYGARPIFYSVFFVSFFAYLGPRASGPMLEDDFMRAPLDFPAGPDHRLRAHEARKDAWLNGMRVGLEKVPFWEVFYRAINESDIVCCRSCREMEGPFGDYFVKHYNKPLIWAGPLIPSPLGSDMGSSGFDEKLDGWLKGFEDRSVVYCAFGSEVVMVRKEEFQELLLGLELTGLPFLAVLKPPFSYETIESALPDGLLERVKERGIIQDCWVPQQLILKHQAVGCFVNHCGAGTLLEALTSECSLVLLPQKCDNFNNARLMSSELRVGLEIERREDDGFFTKEGVCNAIMTMVKGESDVGKEIRDNHAKWREFLLNEKVQESYTNELNHNLQALVELM